LARARLSFGRGRTVSTLPAMSRSSSRNPSAYADPHAGVERQGKQQSIPQMIARIQNCLNMLRRKYFRPTSYRLECDRAALLGLDLGDMVQERIVASRRPAAPVCRLHGDQQPRQLDTVPGRESTEGRVSAASLRLTLATEQ
jgi:hypothetical protein